MAGLELNTMPVIAYIKVEESGRFTVISSYNFTLDRNVDANNKPAGEYIFRHNIASENYTVMVTAYSFSVYGSVVARSSSLFVISLFTYIAAKDNGSFEVIIFKTC